MRSEHIDVGVFVLKRVKNTLLNRIKLRIWKAILPPHIAVTPKDAEDIL